MNQETLKELFIEQIRDVFDAEKQLVKALPKLAKAAESEELAEALRSHLAETQNQRKKRRALFGTSPLLRAPSEWSITRCLRTGPHAQLPSSWISMMQ